MRPIVVLATAFLASSTICVLPALAQTALLDEPSATFKACVNKNAPDVDKAIQPLSEATDFLVQKICAAELADQMAAWAAEQSRKEAEASRAQMKAMCDAREKREPGSESEAHIRSIVGSICDSGDEEYYLAMGGGASIAWMPGLISAPKATAFAAHTLLQLRTQRPDAKP